MKKTGSTGNLLDISNYHKNNKFKRLSVRNSMTIQQQYQKDTSIGKNKKLFVTKVSHIGEMSNLFSTSSRSINGNPNLKDISNNNILNHSVVANDAITQKRLYDELMMLKKKVNYLNSQIALEKSSKRKKDVQINTKARQIISYQSDIKMSKDIAPVNIDKLKNSNIISHLKKEFQTAKDNLNAKKAETKNMENFLKKAKPNILRQENLVLEQNLKDLLKKYKNLLEINSNTTKQLNEMNQLQEIFAKNHGEIERLREKKSNLEANINILQNNINMMNEANIKNDQTLYKQNLNKNNFNKHIEHLMKEKKSKEEIVKMKMTYKQQIAKLEETEKEYKKKLSSNESKIKELKESIALVEKMMKTNPFKIKAFDYSKIKELERNPSEIINSKILLLQSLIDESNNNKKKYEQLINTCIEKFNEIGYDYTQLDKMAQGGEQENPSGSNLEKIEEENKENINQEQNNEEAKNEEKDKQNENAEKKDENEDIVNFNNKKTENNDKDNKNQEQNNNANNNNADNNNTKENKNEEENKIKEENNKQNSPEKKDNNQKENSIHNQKTGGEEINVNKNVNEQNKAKNPSEENKTDADLASKDNLAKKESEIITDKILDNKALTADSLSNEEFTEFTYILIKNFEAKKMGEEVARQKIIMIPSTKDQPDNKKFIDQMSFNIMKSIHCDESNSMEKVKKWLSTLLLLCGNDQKKMTENFLTLFNNITLYTPEQEIILGKKIKKCFLEKKDIICQKLEPFKSKYISFELLKKIIEQQEIEIKDEYVQFLFYDLKKFDDPTASLYDLKVQNLFDILENTENESKMNTESDIEITNEEYVNIITNFGLQLLNYLNVNHTDLRTVLGDIVQNLSGEDTNEKIEVVFIEPFVNRMKEIGIELNDEIKIYCLFSRYKLSDEYEIISVNLLEKELENFRNTKLSVSNEINIINSGKNNDINNMNEIPPGFNNKVMEKVQEENEENISA